MNREILFRGFCERINSWVYGDLNTHDIHHVISILENGVITNPVKKETVGQYTGLLDKTGNKIFEGDIIKGLEITDSETIETIYKVIFQDNGFTVESIEENKSDAWLCLFDGYSICPLTECEIIGNIYDNSELVNK